MPHLETPAQVRSSLDRAQKEGLVDIALAAEKKAKLPRGLLLAIASRETHCRNVVGDGGHGRGYFQIDDRSHKSFLNRTNAGAGVPPVKEAADYAAALVVGNLDFGRGKTVPESKLLKFALSSYNCGAGNAIKGFRNGDSDQITANANYGADVLDRLAIVQDWLDKKVGTATTTRPVLKEGSAGAEVVRLKKLLRKWAKTNRVKPAFVDTPVYGPGTTETVKAFQRANGIQATGKVGKATWETLEKLERMPKPKPKVPQT